MKLVFREYLASLRERRELDAVLPDLLSELGYTVVSRPSIGTRQYGVDVTALGPKDTSGNQRLFLFSIKQGDLTRNDWDGNPQALRSSLNEIIDVFIPTRLTNADRRREIVICLCFGGEIQEAVRDNVVQYINSATTDKRSFEVWNGDHMAGLLVEGVLREGLVDKPLRSHFQKALAMLDQPEAAVQHFSALMDALLRNDNSTTQRRAATLRQLYICLWVLFVWARDIGNLEAPYQLSERALIRCWELAREDVADKRKPAQTVSLILSDLASLHFAIWDALIGDKVLPHVSTYHGVSSAVGSSTNLDVSLNLFKLLGRIATRGLWHLWSRSGAESVPHVVTENIAPASDLAQSIVHLINANPLLLNPVTDSQATDIAAALLFLSMMEEWQAAAKSYLTEMVPRIIFAFKMFERYPIAAADYRTLVSYPTERTPEVRQAETKASSLIPLLAVWSSSCGAGAAAEDLSRFVQSNLAHCAMQIWVVDDNTEDKLYGEDNRHGLALVDIPVTPDGEAAIAILVPECTTEGAFERLSAIRLGHWPLVVHACRYQGLPLPPQLWFRVLQQMRTDQKAPEEI